MPRFLPFLLAMALGLLVALAGSTNASENDEPRPKETPEERAQRLSEGKELDSREAKILDRITIVGSSPNRNLPGSMDRLSPGEISKQNQAFDDVHRMLLRVPGVNITEEDGYGLRPNIGFRGVPTERSASITLMEDGILAAPAPYAAPAAYYFPMTGRMTAIEVRKGSSAIKYGPRTGGGALNVISTPVPSSLLFRVNGTFGEDETGKLHASYGDSRGQVSWLLETYQATTSGFKTLDSGGDTGFRLQDYVGKLRWNSHMDAEVYQDFTLKASYKKEDSQTTYLGLTDQDFSSSAYRRYSGSQVDNMQSEHEGYMARYFVEPSETWDITATVYRTNFHRNWYKLDKVTADGSKASIADILEDPDTYQDQYDILTGNATSDDDALSVKANNREYYGQGVESILGLSLMDDRHQMEFGARFHMDQEDRFQHSDGYRMEKGAAQNVGSMVLTSKGTPGEGGGGNNRVNNARALAVYGQDHFLVSDNLTLTPGLRFEHILGEREQYAAGDNERRGDPTISKNTTNVWIPGLGANLSLSPTWSLLGGVHRGFQPPGPGADDSTKAELSWNFELGAAVSYSLGSARVVGFFNDYENLIGKDTFASGGAGEGEIYNAGKVHTYGLEASLHTDLAGPKDTATRFPLNLGYTFTRSTFRTSFESDFAPWGTVQEGDEQPYLAPHQFSAGLGVERSRWYAGAFLNYAARMRTQAGQGPLEDKYATDARALLDLTGEYRVTSASKIFLSVQNITDNTYIVARRPAGVRPGLPRRIVGGVKLTL